jgi:DNA-binding MarR family transcriptional regulator
MSDRELFADTVGPEVHPELGVQTVSVLCAIAAEDGRLGVTGLQHKVGLTLSGASRNAKLLSPRKVRGKPGFGLIDYRQDPNDYRRETLHLTAAGLRVMNKIVTTMEEK